MTDKKKKKKEKEGFEVDFGLGKVSFGGLFEGIGKLVDLATELEDAGGEIRREGEFDLSKLKKGMKGVYGFSVRSAVGGRPVVETFGNIKKTSKGPVVEEEREPITDVFNEKGEVVIISEIPGIKEEGVILELKDDVLKISAVGKNRKYHKEVLLPAVVKRETMAYTYNNGILEIKIKK